MQVCVQVLTADRYAIPVFTSIYIVVVSAVLCITTHADMTNLVCGYARLVVDSVIKIRCSCLVLSSRNISMVQWNTKILMSDIKK